MINRYALLTFGLVLCGGSALAIPVLNGMGDALKKPIHGTAVTEESVAGKVVLFEYWGTQCPPCRASLPHLQELQKKYARTGKFTVIASHVQGQSDATLALVKAVTFPVYQDLHLGNVPSGRGIPHAYLFDHTGALVQHGDPSKMYKEVPRLVKATPERSGSGPSMLGDVEIKEFTSRTKTLVAGRGIKSTLAYLRTKGTQGNVEAQAICTSVDSWIEAEIASAKALALTSPSQAVEKYALLSKTLTGLPEARAVNAELARLKADPNVRALQLIRRDIERTKASISKSGPTRMTEASAAATIKKLDRLLASQRASKGVLSEATSLKKSL